MCFASWDFPGNNQCLFFFGISHLSAFDKKNFCIRITFDCLYATPWHRTYITHPYNLFYNRVIWNNTICHRGSFFIYTYTDNITKNAKNQLKTTAIPLRQGYVERVRAVFFNKILQQRQTMDLCHPNSVC